MKLIGLTGGIGMGKSTSASLLSLAGLPVIDTDVIAREVVEPGCSALQEIAAHFGPGMLNPDGTLCRERLADVVFNSGPKLRELESILHPRIRERWQAQAAAWRQEGRPAGVVVIPLLYETSAQSEFDIIICAACSAHTQQERLLARGWSVSQIQQRMAAQWPAERKMAASNFVIWTEGVMELHRHQLRRVLARIIVAG